MEEGMYVKMGRREVAAACILGLATAPCHIVGVDVGGVGVGPGA